jgi:hypothetical protein
MTDTLDGALLKAHALDDRHALIGLYERAANQAMNDDAAGFYLTHAYIFALDQGDPRAMPLRSRLVEMGRETAN